MRDVPGSMSAMSDARARSRDVLSRSRASGDVFDSVAWDGRLGVASALLRGRVGLLSMMRMEKGRLQRRRRFVW